MVEEHTETSVVRLPDSHVAVKITMKGKGEETLYLDSREFYYGVSTTE